MSISGISKFIVTGAYSGYAPKMPGTFGTLAAVLLLAALQLVFPAAQQQLPLLLCFLSLALGTPALAFLLRNNALSSIEDPQEAVIDEFAGYYLSLFFAPLSLQSMVFAFFLFRLFDVSKPPPIKKLEALPGAIGVMADDLGAGLAALFFLHLLAHFFPQLM